MILYHLSTVSLQVIFFLLKKASYHGYPLSTVDIQGEFLNAEFIPKDTPIYLKINKDIVPYCTRQDPMALPWVSGYGELRILLDQFFYGLKHCRR